MFDDVTTNNKSLNQTPVCVIYFSIVHRKVLVNKKSNKNSGGYVHPILCIFILIFTRRCRGLSYKNINHFNNSQEEQTAPVISLKFGFLTISGGLILQIICDHILRRSAPIGASKRREVTTF